MGAWTQSKNTIVFRCAKKAIRTLIPGFANYFYNKDTGEKPRHTKKAFTDNEIMTVHNQVVLNVLVFMHKVHRGVAPNSIERIFNKEFVDENNRDIPITPHEPREIF